MPAPASPCLPHPAIPILSHRVPACPTLHQQLPMPVYACLCLPMPACACLLVASCLFYQVYVCVCFCFITCGVGLSDRLRYIGRAAFARPQAWVMYGCLLCVGPTIWTFGSYAQHDAKLITIVSGAVRSRRSSLWGLADQVGGRARPHPPAQRRGRRIAMAVNRAHNMLQPWGAGGRHHLGAFCLGPPCL